MAHTPPLTDEDLRRRLELVASAFSPSAPVTSARLFAGRRAEMSRLIEVVRQNGQHAVVYGERGVGKTSLARVVAESLGEEVVSPYFTCSTGDTFGSIWKRAMREIDLVVKKPNLGYGKGSTQLTFNFADLLGESDTVTPDDVRVLLKQVTEVRGPAVVFIDEFDQPEDLQSRALFADTIKILSDQGIAATLVLVGVAEDVEELIAQHASIERSLIQIEMPTMGDDELAEIIVSGMAEVDMTADPAFVERVTIISQGLPHYTHLIAQHGARHALKEGRIYVEADDTIPAVTSALKDVSATVRDTYISATHSSRDTIYADVLLACARAKKNEQSMFTSVDVRDQLRSLTGKPYEIPAFAGHLNGFSSDDGPRGGVLQKRGTSRRFRYRFKNPLVAPYVIMKGTADGRI